MSQHGESGLFYSSVLIQQTSVSPELSDELSRGEGGWTDQEWQRKSRCLDYVIQPANEIETAFRHGVWSDQRAKVRDAMARANLPDQRLERFDACGANCTIEYSASTERYRCRANYCGDRFCVPCCLARSKKVQANVVEWAKGRRVRFVTLTRASAGEDLKTALDELNQSFRRLRYTAFWKQHVDAGISAVEITRGKTGDHWHVHIHALVCGTWLPQEELSNEWAKASRGSFVVDIRKVRDTNDAVRYCLKYATKGWSNQVLENPEWLLECMVALRGRRLLTTFGEWYDRDEVVRVEPVGDWKHVGWIKEIHGAAGRGEPWAIAVLRGLGVFRNRADVVSGYAASKIDWSGPSVCASDT